MNKSSPPPLTSASKKLPFAQILHATLPPVSASLVPPIHELTAETTADASWRGTRIQTYLSIGCDPEGFVSGVTERMSMGIEVPERPRNCERAAFRCVRAVRGSMGVALVAVEVLGW